MAQEPLFEQSDAQMAWDDLRTSKAFPAIVGGLAGASVGVALMFIASRMRAPKKTLPAAYDANGNPMNIVYLPAPSQPRILGFTLGDLVTLGTVGLTMFRQMQEMVNAQQAKQEPMSLPNDSMVSPSSSESKKTSHKK